MTDNELRSLGVNVEAARSALVPLRVPVKLGCGVCGASGTVAHVRAGLTPAQVGDEIRKWGEMLCGHEALVASCVLNKDGTPPA